MWFHQILRDVRVVQQPKGTLKLLASASDSNAKMPPSVFQIKSATKNHSPENERQVPPDRFSHFMEMIRTLIVRRKVNESSDKRKLVFKKFHVSLDIAGLTRSLSPMR